MIGFVRGGGMGMFGGTDVGLIRGMRGVGRTTRAAVIVKLGEGGYLTKCE